MGGPGSGNPKLNQNPKLIQVNRGPRVKPTTAQRMVVWNLREEARRLGEKGLDVVSKCLASTDEKVRLAAALVIFERGWGKPTELVDMTLTHNFAEVPQVMKIEDWLRTRGQPQLLGPAAGETGSRRREQELESASSAWPLAEPCNGKPDDEPGSKLN